MTRTGIKVIKVNKNQRGSHLKVTNDTAFIVFGFEGLQIYRTN